jgi:hypothetical protein
MAAEETMGDRPSATFILAPVIPEQVAISAYW